MQRPNFINKSIFTQVVNKSTEMTILRLGYYLTERLKC